jgi:hypothetical protein
MGTAAKSGFGSAIYIGDGAGPEVFNYLPEVCGDIQGPGITRRILDFTHSKSSYGISEEKGAIRDLRDWSFPLHWVPSNTYHQQLFADKLSAVLRNWKIPWPGEVRTLSTITGGTGFTNNEIVTLNYGNGEATARATVAAGVITALTLLSKGRGYIPKTGVPIVGTGTGATVDITFVDFGYWAITAYVGDLSRPMNVAGKLLLNVTLIPSGPPVLND